jgi:hypothetical protein
MWHGPRIHSRVPPTACPFGFRMLCAAMAAMAYGVISAPGFDIDGIGSGCRHLRPP